MHLSQFVAKWRGTTLKERSAAQEQVIELCRLFGAHPGRGGPAGASFAFKQAAIATAAAELDRLRQAWLDPEGANAAELKKRTLTNLYNARPVWLAHSHAALDRAVWAAYGWEDADPTAVAEDAILARLLELNLARAAASG